MKINLIDKSVRVHSTLMGLAMLLIATTVQVHSRAPSFPQAKIGASALSSTPATLVPREPDWDSDRNGADQAIGVSVSPDATRPSSSSSGVLFDAEEHAETCGAGTCDGSDYAGRQFRVSSRTFLPDARAVTVSSPWTGHNTTVQRDLGFRPARDGYSFTNSVEITPDCQSLRQSFSGLDIQCSNGLPQQRYLPLFERFKFSFGTGICTGMAVASLAYYVGIKAPPRPTTTFSLTLDQAWPNIATFHGRQYSKAVLDRLILGLSAWNTTDTHVISHRVDEIYNQLVSAVRPDNPDPLVLDLVARPGCDAPGHTVAPYRLDETDPLRPKVYVYENYAAGDSTKFIAFDFSSPDHRFSYWKWDSAACSALIALPISAFVGPEDKIPSQYLERYK
jgi:hypothetical protein